MVKLSIVMMVKNESKYLQACLQGVQPIRDSIDSELIIVDTGSTDNTVEIARAFTEKVYFHKWNNDFSEIRNITIDYSIGEWIMFLDGDEIIKDATDIINFFKSDTQTKYNTACISIKSFTSSFDEQMYSTIFAPRIFKNDGEVHFEGEIHEQLKYKQPMLFLDTEVMHFGYINDDAELMEKKFLRTSKMLIDKLNIEPESIYYNYQLAITYAMHKDYYKSLEKTKKAYNIAKKSGKDMIKCTYIYTHLSKMYICNSEYSQSEKICIEAIEYDSEYIDLYFFLAKSQYMMNKNKEAIENYEIYLKKISKYADSNIPRNTLIDYSTLSTYDEAYLDLSHIYYNQHQYDTCLNYAKKIKTKTYIDGAILKVVEASIKLKKYAELREYYEKEICKEHADFVNSFILKLEKKLINLNENEKEGIYYFFSKGTTEYSLLNKIRLEKGRIEEEYISNIDILDFNIIPDYYADILYYLMLNNISINNILEKTCDFRVKDFFNYLISVHKDFGNIVYDYLIEFDKHKNKDLNIRIRKILTYNVLCYMTLGKEQYKEMFFMYLKAGMEYLELIYNENVIKNEIICSMKNEEDLLLMYIKMANNRIGNKADYIKYLRKALSLNSYMSRGIDILREEATKDFEIQDSNFELYKEKVKKSISELINNNKIESAKLLINEYSNIVHVDVEIESMKAVIAILENRLVEAESILKSAINEFRNSFDLIYNLAYVYEQMGNNQKALYFYKKTINLVSEPSLAEDINNKIKNLEKELYGYSDIAR
jgi:glycosyltransferase involved in cell wall biosynthesis